MIYQRNLTYARLHELGNTWKYVRPVYSLDPRFDGASQNRKAKALIRFRLSCDSLMIRCEERSSCVRGVLASCLPS
jgi:hypothetical protein